MIEQSFLKLRSKVANLIKSNHENPILAATINELSFQYALPQHLPNSFYDLKQMISCRSSAILAKQLGLFELSIEIIN